MGFLDSNGSIMPERLFAHALRDWHKHAQTESFAMSLLIIQFLDSYPLITVNRHWHLDNGILNSIAFFRAGLNKLLSSLSLPLLFTILPEFAAIVYHRVITLCIFKKAKAKLPLPSLRSKKYELNVLKLPVMTVSTINNRTPKAFLSIVKDNRLTWSDGPCRIIKFNCYHLIII